MDAEFISTEEAAAELRVSTRRVRALIKDGRLKATTIGEGNRATHKIRRADLDAVRNRKTGRPPGSATTSDAKKSHKPAIKKRGGKNGNAKGDV